MEIETSEITPAAGPAAPAPVEPAAEPAEEMPLPEELLAQPFIGALMNGKPPAVYVPNDFTSPEVELVIQNAEALGQAGFRIYPSKKKPVTVLYNAIELSPEEVAKADEEGKLDQIAVPFQELQEVFAGAQAEKTAPSGGGASAAPAAVPSTPPSKSVTTARVKNLSPGTPTSGPVPGQGRLLNNILKPVV